MIDSIRFTIRSELLEAASYRVEDAKGLLKLDAMESPYGLSGDMLMHWLDRLSSANINRYPDPTASHLAVSLSKRLGLTHDVGVMFGNGSDELIQILIQAVASANASVFAPSPSFVMYKNICDWNRVEFITSDLMSDFSLDIESTLSLIEQKQPKLIFLAQPNNPTANLWSQTALEQIVKIARGLVVIDEAYAPYSKQTYIKWASQYDNVVVLRTFSKQGFAGARLGYLVGKKHWLEQLDKIRMPYNVSVLAQVTGAHLVEHWDHYNELAATIKTEREWLSETLIAMGLEVFASEANFLVVKSRYSGAELSAKLKNLGVLIKNLCGSHPILKNCIRVTVSTRDENTQFVAALEQALENID